MVLHRRRCGRVGRRRTPSWTARVPDPGSGRSYHVRTRHRRPIRPAQSGPRGRCLVSPTHDHRGGGDRGDRAGGGDRPRGGRGRGRDRAQPPRPDGDRRHGGGARGRGRDRDREPGPERRPERERDRRTRPRRPEPLPRPVASGRPEPPEPPEDARPEDLDRSVREELRTLPRSTADRVARHLVAAGRLVEEDPSAALAHAMAARRLAPRVGAVREAVGIAAYRAEDWRTAITELRAHQRITGRFSHVAVVADSERALGRPRRAIDLYSSTTRDRLTTAEAVELLIVAAGARRDMGQLPAAVAMRQVPELTRPGPWAARLRYAYADALLAAGRVTEAREWFARAVDADEEAATDAAERLLELDGVVMEEPEDDGAADPGENPGADGTTGPRDSAGGEDIAGGHGTGSAEPNPGGPDPVTRVRQAPPAGPVEVVSPPRVRAGAGRLADAYDVVVLDLDGVVYLGEEAVPGAADTVAA